MCCNMTYTAGRAALQPLWAVLRVLENIPVIGHLIAAIYACCCLKDKAERAGIKATVGIVCAAVNLPAEAVDEVIRHRSDKLYAHTLTSRPDWMSKFPRRTIRQLCLPASHQSATYNMDHKLQQIPLIEGWSRCQKLTIEQQLYGGVRFLDLRLMSDDKTKEIWLHHNVVVCLTLKDVLQQVRDFVVEFPSEIISLYVTNDGKALDWPVVNSYISEYLGTKLIDESMKNMRIGDIVQKGKNIILFGVPRVANSWRCLDYRWPNKPWPEDLESDMGSTLRDLSTHNPYQMFWYKAECTPNAMAIVRNIGGVPGLVVAPRADEKFEFLEDMASSVNQRVLVVLHDVIRMPFNVLSTDFVQDDIVGRIVDLNMNEETGIGQYNTTADTMMTSDDGSSLNDSVPAVVVDMSLAQHTRPGLMEVWESSI